VAVAESATDNALPDHVTIPVHRRSEAVYLHYRHFGAGGVGNRGANNYQAGLIGDTHWPNGPGLTGTAWLMRWFSWRSEPPELYLVRVWRACWRLYAPVCPESTKRWFTVMTAKAHFGRVW
jgi:hypothetical protein